MELLKFVEDWIDERTNFGSRKDFDNGMSAKTHDQYGIASGMKEWERRLTD